MLNTTQADASSINSDKTVECAIGDANPNGASKQYDPLIGGYRIFMVRTPRIVTKYFPDECCRE